MRPRGRFLASPSQKNLFPIPRTKSQTRPHSKAHMECRRSVDTVWTERPHSLQKPSVTPNVPVFWKKAPKGRGPSAQGKRSIALGLDGDHARPEGQRYGTSPDHKEWSSRRFCPFTIQRAFSPSAPLRRKPRSMPGAEGSRPFVAEERTNLSHSFHRRRHSRTKPTPPHPPSTTRSRKDSTSRL